MKKKFMLIVAVLAVLAGIFGLSAAKADAAGTPDQAACFLQSPNLATQWQVSSDYFWGIMAPDNSHIKQAFKYEGMTSRGAKRLVMSFHAKKQTHLTAQACYEEFIVDQMVNPDGSPMYFADGTPVTYQRVVHSYWAPANAARMVVWTGSEQTGVIGTHGKNLVAWVIGGGK